MKRHSLLLCLLLLLYMASACSSQLTRNEARRKIDDMMRFHQAGSQQIMSAAGKVPGYELQEDDIGHVNLGLGRINADLEMPLENALVKLGYITIKNAGLADKNTDPAYPFKHSDKMVMVSLTNKVGTVVGKIPNTENGVIYQGGFECFPEPQALCSVPLIESGYDYQITGIIQDEIHAKANILIPWKLTHVALELRPFAKAGRYSPLMGSQMWDPWEEFLNAHSASGLEPATILFQKFDDGWRIVDQNGKG